MNNNGSLKRIILIALAALALCAFGLFAWMQHRGDAARQAELEALARQTAAEQIERRNAAKPLYTGLVERIEATLPGIVCWGDESLTPAGVWPIPSQLESEATRRLLADAEDAFQAYVPLQLAQSLKISAYNMSVVGESLELVGARAGLQPLFLGNTIFLSPGLERRDVFLTDASRRTLQFKAQQYATFGAVTIDTIEGHFYTGSSGSGDQLAFGRDHNGYSAQLPSGTEVRVESAERYRDCAMVLYFTSPVDDDGREDIDALIEFYDAMLARQQKNANHYVVLCRTGDGGVNDALSARYGAHYIHVADGEVDYAALTAQILDALDAQGCFDGVRRSVTETMAQLDALKAGSPVQE